MRASIRKDLKDTDAAAYRWTDVELDRHIGRAVAEYSEACPLLAVTTKEAGASATYDLSGEVGYLWCELAEWPVDQAPQALIGVHEQVKGMVALLLDQGDLPAAGESVKFYYAKAHTLGAGSTLPTEHEEVVARGAVACALASMARYAVDRVAASGRSAAEWQALAAAEMKGFRAELERIRRPARSLVAVWGEKGVAWDSV